jgi:hypothetical protein
MGDLQMTLYCDVKIPRNISNTRLLISYYPAHVRLILYRRGMNRETPN